MKTFSRSQLLTGIVVAALLAAIPFAVLDFMQSGELYLLSSRFGEDVIMRLSGPGRIRFIIQPTTAIVLGTRDGAKDARAQIPPFLSALVFRNAEYGSLWRTAVSSVRDLVAIAILADLVVQYLLLPVVHPSAALLVGPTLIAAPYAVSRALANRFVRWRGEPTLTTQIT